MNLTDDIAPAMDELRKVFFGEDARLVILKHAQAAGYTKGLEVFTGWLPDDEAGGGGESVGQISMEVRESETITAEMLAECSAFAFLRSGENAALTIVYKVVSKNEPLDELDRVWLFLITPNKKERIAI